MSAGEARVARRRGEAHHASQLVVIGEGERGQPQLRRARDEQLRERRRRRGGRSGVAVQLGVGHRSQSPVRGAFGPQSPQLCSRHDSSARSQYTVSSPVVLSQRQ